ncbi:MAG: hypothetical protein GY869_13735 [Planctomycetes bacterium]|nr:hypothetical protein [Planctomycetota bacterium]
MAAIYRQLIIAGLIVLLGTAAGLAQVQTQEKEMLGDGNDGNRSIPVHLMELMVQIFEGDPPEKVLPDEESALPFALRYTCGECHTYSFINEGWHFNSSKDVSDPGRPAEPWVWVDGATRTIIPVSDRGWNGTYKPDQIGLTPWRMIKLFGRHMPGGDYGEIYAEQLDGLDREMISGEFEINCLICHNADNRQDLSEAALQTMRENFRWNAAASSGIAYVDGDASTLPPSYDVLMGIPPDNPSQQPPVVHYDLNRFDAINRVFIDIVRRVPNERCYFCHSTQVLGMDELNEWQRDQDIHITSGLMCVDCHRHSVDHQMVRGFEGEKRAVSSESVPSLTCKGCHYPELEENGTHAAALPGRLGAPRPIHKGIPLVHFEKLTCTVCHSGPVPAALPDRVRTPRIHRLGLHGVHRADYNLPHVQAPVFVRNAEGKIEPSKLIWPSFWARMKNDQVTPIAVEIVQQVAGDILDTTEAQRRDDWPELTEEQIAQALTVLDTVEETEAVYIAGGKLYRLDEQENVITDDHEAADPYTWPIGHDVRPAQQSLGYNGRCADCHDQDSPIFFGNVVVDSPIQGQSDLTRPMYDLLGEDGDYWKSFNSSFAFRTFLKTVGFIASGLLVAVLLLFGLLALKRVIFSCECQNPEDMEKI